METGFGIYPQFFCPKCGEYHASLTTCPTKYKQVMQTPWGPYYCGVCAIFGMCRLSESIVTKSPKADPLSNFARSIPCKTYRKKESVCGNGL